jgi:Plasmid pRiA4b ORF-3-like protein
LNPYLNRHIEIESQKSLYQLAESVVQAFDFDFDHAFSFYSVLTGNVLPSPIRYELFADMDSESGARSVKCSKIAETFPKVGGKMTFLFDYSDGWEFRVELIGMGQMKPRTGSSNVLAMVGKAPAQYPDADEEE